MAAGALIERLRRFASPLIREQLESSGLRPEDLALADWARVRPLGAAALDFERRDDPIAALRLTNAPPPVRVGTCARGGTTVLLSWTGRDLERMSRAGARLFASVGVGAGTRVANTLEGGFETPGSLSVGDAVETVGGLDVPLGPARDGSAGRAIRDFIDRVGTEVLVVDGGTATGLLRELAARPPRAWRGTLWLGTDRPPPNLRGWCRRWLSVPEVSVFAAVECGRGAFHVDPDLVVEVESGRLLFSSLSADAPLLRYDAGVSARTILDSCACGSLPPAVVLAEGQT